jgi:hypothetical protein
VQLRTVDLSVPRGYVTHKFVFLLKLESSALTSELQILFHLLPICYMLNHMLNHLPCLYIFLAFLLYFSLFYFSLTEVLETEGSLISQKGNYFIM